MVTKERGYNRFARYGSYGDLNIYGVNINPSTFIVCKNGSRIQNPILHVFYIFSETIFTDEYP